MTGRVSPAGRHQYVLRCAQVGDCAHGQLGGNVCRPATGTPSCALCRRNWSGTWAPLWPTATEAPPVNVTRRLW